MSLDFSGLEDFGIPFLPFGMPGESAAGRISTEEPRSTGGPGTGVPVPAPPTQGGLAAQSRYTDRLTERPPPKGCIVVGIVVSPKQLLPTDDAEDLNTVISRMNIFQKNKLATAQAGWKVKYPFAPLPALILQYVKPPGSSIANPVVYALRSPDGWDPELLTHPILPPCKTTKDGLLCDPQTSAFETALRVFFPEYVIETVGLNPGHMIREGKIGSMTPDGPFPYWKKLVSSGYIDALVNYFRTTPDAFGTVGVAGNFDASGRLLAGALGAGAKGFAAGMTAGPLGGAIVGAGSFVVSLFKDLFDFFGTNRDAPQPEWLKKLLAIAATRKSKFSSAHPGTESYAKSGIACHRAYIVEDGQYDLLEGYAEFLRRMSGAKAALPWWLIVGGGVAAALLTS